MRNATKTQNPKWLEQGFDSPYQPFPDYDYLDFLIDYLRPKRDMRLEWVRSQVPDDPKRGARERTIEKSRTMLGTWTCVAYYTHRAMTVPSQEFIFQSQTQEKAEELIDYAKILWDQQEDWLKAEFPLDRRLGDFPKDMLRFATGSRLMAIPNDPNKIRMFHPTGILMDEAAFLGEFKNNRDTAMQACSEIVYLSSAGPSEFGEFVQS